MTSSATASPDRGAGQDELDREVRQRPRLDDSPLLGVLRLPDHLGFEPAGLIALDRGHDRVGQLVIMRPVLDDEQAARAEVREQALEGGSGFGKPVGGVVDHQVDRRTAELGGHDLRETGTVGLVDPVARLHTVGDAGLRDVVVEHLHGLWVDLDRDQLRRLGQLTEERGTAPTADAQLEDHLGLLGCAHRDVLLDRRSRLGDREVALRAHTLGKLAMEVPLADPYVVLAGELDRL